MKIVINTSNLPGGGGLQVALSFLQELKHIDHNNKYYIFLSKAANRQILKNEFPNNFQFYLMEKSPASLKTRKSIVNKLNKLEQQILPDIVFSVFGPSYWCPKAKHLIGVADGWIYNADSVAYGKLSIIEQIKRRLLGKYKIYHLKQDADFYLLETEDAKMKFIETTGIKEDTVLVVGNTHSSAFNNEVYLNKNNNHYIKLPKKLEKEFRLIYITSYKANKNIEVISEILPFLEGYNVKFILTLDNNIFQKLFPNQTDKVINLSPIPHNSCPSVYKQCDALFAPTLLETFSAAYPEAMKMEKPILTSNYSFATDVCQDAALYFDPLDPENIAEKIKKLINDKKLQKELIKKGKKRVQEFETARSRAEKYIEICEKVASQQR